MSNTVSWNLTADETRFMQACLKASNALNNVSAAGRSAGQQTSSAFQDAFGSVTKFAASLGIITTATGAVMAIASQLKAEYEHLTSRQREAAFAQMSVGEARATALMNKPADMSQEWLDALITRTSEQQQVDQKRMWQVASSLLSSKGPLSNEAFASALGETARVGALTGQGVDLPVLGGGLQDIMRVIGVQRPEQAGGWIRQIGQQARVVELGKQISAIVPAISAAKPYGWKPEQAAEFLAYLTQMAGDVEGRKSSTGTVSFMEQLDAARTESGAIIPEKSVFGKIKFRPLKSRGFDAIGELQDWYASADEPMREEFRNKLQGEKKVKGGLLSLIARDPNALAAFAEVQRQITDPKAGGVEQNWTDYFKSVAAGPHEGVRTVHRILTQIKESMKLGDKTALSGVIRDDLKEALGDTPGVSQAEIDWTMGIWELQSGFGRNPQAGLQSAIQTFDRLHRDPNNKRYKHFRSGFLGMPEGNWRTNELPANAEQVSPGKWRLRRDTYEANPDYNEGRDAALETAISFLKEAAASLAITAASSADAAKGLKTAADESRRPVPGAQVE